MSISHSSSHPEHRSRDAVAERKRDVKISSFAGGLSAWLGGVAFCVGFGVSAPSWVALILTVFILAAGKVSHAVLRRNPPLTDRPAG